jgi:hypothetical protein
LFAVHFYDFAILRFSLLLSVVFFVILPFVPHCRLRLRAKRIKLTRGYASDFHQHRTWLCGLAAIPSHLKLKTSKSHIFYGRI